MNLKRFDLLQIQIPARGSRSVIFLDSVSDRGEIRALSVGKSDFGYILLLNKKRFVEADGSRSSLTLDIRKWPRFVKSGWVKHRLLVSEAHLKTLQRSLIVPHEKNTAHLELWNTAQRAYCDSNYCTALKLLSKLEQTRIFPYQREISKKVRKKLLSRQEERNDNCEFGNEIKAPVSYFLNKPWVKDYRNVVVKRRIRSSWGKIKMTESSAPALEINLKELESKLSGSNSKPKQTIKKGKLYTTGIKFFSVNE